MFLLPLTGFIGYLNYTEEKKLFLNWAKHCRIDPLSNLGNLSQTLQMFLVHYLFHITAKLPRYLKNQRCWKNYPWIFIVNLDCELIKPVETKHVQFVKCGYARYSLTFFMIPSVDNTLKPYLLKILPLWWIFLRARFSFEVFLRLLLINFVSFFLSFSKRIVCAVKWVTFYWNIILFYVQVFWKEEIFSTLDVICKTKLLNNLPSCCYSWFITSKRIEKIKHFFSN